MNLLLLHPGDINSSCHNQYDAVISNPEKIRHITRVLKLKEGDNLRTGILNGKWGYALITSMNQNQITLTLKAEHNPPSPQSTQVMIALPRPPVFKRLLINLASFGIKNIIFFHSEKVEKSFWQSPALKESNIQRLLIEGLEQGKDTLMPEVAFCKKPDLLMQHAINPEHCEKFLCHPHICSIDTDTVTNAGTWPATEQKLVCIGPEGGFTDQEVEWFLNQGFVQKHLGEHILKVETAVFTALGSLL